MGMDFMSRTKRKLPKPEQCTQMALIEWFRIQYPFYYDIPIKITNEGEAMHGYAHEMGLNPGASDLFFPIPKGIYCGLFLEIKKDGFTFSSSTKAHIARQLSFLNKMRIMGYWAEMGVGIDQCIEIVKHYMLIKDVV